MCVEASKTTLRPISPNKPPKSTEPYPSIAFRGIANPRSEAPPKIDAVMPKLSGRTDKLISLISANKGDAERPRNIQANPWRAIRETLLLVLIICCPFL